MGETEVIRSLKTAGVDVSLTKEILTNFNEGIYDRFGPVVVSDIPSIDDNRIRDLRGSISVSVDLETAERRIESIDGTLDLREYGSCQGDTVLFKRSGLERLGVMLSGAVAYGILNGGSATSYGDRKKNRSLDPQIFDGFEATFDKIAPHVSGQPKGVTPAFIQPDGSYGPSFIELKMRNLLLNAEKHLRLKKQPGEGPLYPLFQMTSVHTDTEIAARYEEYRTSEYLEDLIDSTGLDITNAYTAVQPLIAAFTQGCPKKIFSNAYGKQGEGLPLPGGHGQNFMVLKDIYLRLFEEGKRYVYLTNVDNLGSTFDPVEIAMLALTGKQAAFEFSFRTRVDVKGGILVIDETGSLNCADIGPAVSPGEVKQAEADGKEILFNCATGIFDLAYLSTHIDEIIENLPMRFSDQEKDAGSYSQAEQVTWEVLGLLDDFLVFGVDKFDRFLAAKLLLENFLTSGLEPDSENTESELLDIGGKLHEGLKRKLEGEYGLRQIDGRWEPIPVSDLTG
jgi:UTP--glucose-1-phosphate uridylyltransferase